LAGLPVAARRDPQQPGHRAGLDDVVCGVTGCSVNPSRATSICIFYRHAPGNPKPGHYLCPPGHPRVDLVGSNSGPADGGTAVEIHGKNFGWLTGVFSGPGS
jgi:hypothetical protein